VQEGKLERASLHPWWDDFRYALVLVQEGKLAHASFRPRWNHVVRDVLVILQEGNPT
jgi:hypothetical protein